MEDGDCERVLQGHTQPVCSVAVLSAGLGPRDRRGEGGMIVSGGVDRLLMIWDMETGGEDEGRQEGRVGRDWCIDIGSWMAEMVE